MFPTYQRGPNIVQANTAGEWKCQSLTSLHSVYLLVLLWILRTGPASNRQSSGDTTPISTEKKTIQFHLFLEMHRFMLRYCCKIHWTPLKKKLVLDLNEYYKSSIPRNLNLFYLFTSIDWLDQELEVRHLDPRCVSLWPQRKANKPAVDKNGRNGPMNRKVGLWMSRRILVKLELETM